MSHANQPAPTQVAQPWRAAVRTAVQVFLSAWSILGALLLIAPQIIDELSAVLPPEWIAWLVSAVAFLSVVAGVIARVMAIPAVNAFLTRFNAGAASK